MVNDNIARRLLIEQTRKELLDDIKKYVVGMTVNGEFIVKRNSSIDGWVIILPDEKYKEYYSHRHPRA